MTARKVFQTRDSKLGGKAVEKPAESVTLRAPYGKDGLD